VRYRRIHNQEKEAIFITANFININNFIFELSANFNIISIRRFYIAKIILSRTVGIGIGGRHDGAFVISEKENQTGDKKRVV
jgi:hypothetical protein